MNDIEKMMSQIAFVSLGILPLENGESVVEAFKHMSSEDATQMKRKFRKIWRSLAKNGAKLADRNLSPKEATQHMKPPVKKNEQKDEPTAVVHPDKQVLSARRNIVRSHVWMTKVYPMLDATKVAKKKSTED